MVAEVDRLDVAGPGHLAFVIKQVESALQLLGPDREELIPQDATRARSGQRWKAYGSGDPPPIAASACAHAVRLIFDSYRVAAAA